MKKRYTIIVIALVLIFALAACGQSESLSTKAGVLLEASNFSINIQAPDGTTYTFGVDDKTVIQGSENLGDTLEVSFLGDFTSGITAASIKTISQAETTAVHDDGTPAKGTTDQQGAPQPAHPPASGEKMTFFAGIVTEFSSTSISVYFQDGNTYTLKIDPNAIIDPGITEHCKVRVFHTGTLKSGIVTKEINLVEGPPPALNTGNTGPG
ncbi:MAG: hypothetical protein FWD44_05845 [Oscillospiraceae bacterium]|nr:hypothetical protein [Oscillospiraceae bacterium]